MRSKFTRSPHHEIGRLALLALVVTLAGCTATAATPAAPPSPTPSGAVTVEFRLSSPKPETVVEVSWGDGGSTDSRKHQTLPWSVQITAQSSYNFVSMRATDEHEDGDLLCEILVNGQVVDQHEVSTTGYAVIGCFEDLG